MGYNTFNLLVRPDGQLISGRIQELKPAPTRKGEYVFGDLPAGISHPVLRSFQILMVQNHEGPVDDRIIRHFEATINSATGERRVSGAVIRELPLEGPGIEVFDLIQVFRPEFYVVNVIVG